MISAIAKQIKFGLLTLNYSFLAVLTLSFFFIQLDLFNLGTLAGRFAIYTFWLIAIPGILSRFKVVGILKDVQTILKINRRQLGILMFILTAIHYFWVRGFDCILNGFPTVVPLYQIAGTLGFFLCLPLLITSNNYSVKKMRKWWQRLHNLTYPVMFLLVIHTSFQPGREVIGGVRLNLANALQYGLPTLIILLIQIYSWIYFTRNSKA